MNRVREALDSELDKRGLVTLGTSLGNRCGNDDASWVWLVRDSSDDYEEECGPELARELQGVLDGIYKKIGYLNDEELAAHKAKKKALAAKRGRATKAKNAKAVHRTGAPA